MNKTSKNRMRWSFVFVVALFLSGQSCFTSGDAYAYSDEVGASFNEIWKAAESVFQSRGLSEKDIESGTMTSRWTEDTVKRSRGLLRGILRHTVFRRYRIKATIRKGELAQDLQLSVIVQERSRSANPSVPWKDVRPETEDFVLEREYFMKILDQLALMKRSAP